ncbi:hypothetical protein PMAYCL1PPCAC_24488 [Pristionchus mayeri]|uniref:Tyrosine phosphatase n=1 Tax=Pristionchus mayeri TaxID=1317129 RepID=A0AAN5D0J4_9BILA|nr:hypothetical protein PMAYCL1PPCAC_24488 [Pristionchus mayeri]
METFWRLVYDANVANVFFLEPAGKDFSQLAHFLPLEPASSKDYGKMFVNNKKVERNPKEYQAVVEVLPEGCSNSIIVRFIQGRQWPEHVARKYRRIALHMVRTLKNEKSTSLIVCKDGRGKSGQFILLHSAISDLSNPDYKFKMAESLASLRHMRWGAIQTDQQYLLMYMLSLDFAVCKFKATFEGQARNLERSILDHMKKLKESAKPVTPKETKEKVDKKEEKTEKTDKEKYKTVEEKKEIEKEKKKDEKDEKKEKEKDEEKEKEKAPDTVKQATEAATQFGHIGHKEPEKESGAPPIVQSLYL